MAYREPFILSYDVSGPQTFENPDGSTYDATNPEEETSGNELIIVSPQDGPPVLVTPAGTPVDLTDNLVKPYSQTTPPGVISYPS